MNPPISMVLDTNVVLDWLVFADASLAKVVSGIQDGQIRVLTHPFAVEELRRVLAYPLLRLASDQQAAILARYGQQTTVPMLPAGFSAANLLLPAGFPQCHDPDDQPFLALTYYAHACALVTRDKQLLRLRKRAAQFGVQVVEVKQASVLVTHLAS